MSGLPDDLRSLAKKERGFATIRGEDNADLMERAADELDARAARILRLEMVIKRAMTVASAADAPDDEWVQDLEMKFTPAPSGVKEGGAATPPSDVTITASAIVARWPNPLRIDLPGGGTIWISR